MMVKKIKSASAADILSRNLNHFMDAENSHEAELARQTKIPQPTLHKLLTGKTEDPRFSTLQILAHYFGVTIDVLYSDTLLQKNINVPTGKPIPIISWSDCTQYKTILKKSSVTHCSQWVLVDGHHHDQLFALKSKASADTHFPRGTVFIVDPKVTPSDGDFVVVHYHDTVEATLRELSVDGRVTALLSLNAKNTFDKLTKSTVLLGVVIESRFSYGE